jgi:beta-galactosidase
MIYYGAAYYPEQETPEDIETDIRHMRDIGFNAMRIGEFAWSKFEPREGRYDFAWCDHVVNRMGAGGISTLLCTPSACPPPWMIEKHPEILYRDNRGVIRPVGGRRHYCYNVPVYRDYCRRMADQIGQRYGKHPHVLGFHIDNELGQEGTARCHCDVCKGKFQQWLQKKYGTIENYNKRAGTVFWSMVYDRFEQIDPPLRTIEPGAANPIESFVDNPTIRIEWERFCGESIVEHLDNQVQVIRKHSAKPTTTNCTGWSTGAFDVFKAGEKVDVHSNDLYPSLRTNDLRKVTPDFAFQRGIKGKKYWCPETTSGGGQGVWNQQGILQPSPGSIFQNAMHLFATGAELVTYFQFKMFRFGAEQLEAAVMGIDGIPDRRYKEYQQVAREIPKLEKVLSTTTVHSEVGIVFDYDTMRSILIKPFRVGYDYRNQTVEIATALSRFGVGTDYVPFTDRIREYKMVVIPTPVIMTDAQKSLLREYVAGGGVVVSNFLAAIKDEYNTAPRAAIPAGLTDLFGIRVTEGEPVMPETVAHIALGVGDHPAPVPNQVWTESLELKGAEPIGRYADTFRAGEVVATRHKFGKGSAWYLGTWFDQKPLGELLSKAADSAGVERCPIHVGDNAEVITRADGKRRVYFVFNYHQEKSTTVELNKPLKNIHTGQQLSGSISLEKKGYLLLQS